MSKEKNGKKLQNKLQVIITTVPQNNHELLPAFHILFFLNQISTDFPVLTDNWFLFPIWLPSFNIQHKPPKSRIFKENKTANNEPYTFMSLYLRIETKQGGGQ